jgi:hypothetical protein
MESYRKIVREAKESHSKPSILNEAKERQKFDKRRAKMVEQLTDDPSVAALFGAMLESGVIGHIYHLQTSSSSMHLALNDFYNSAPYITDRVIEAFQGSYNTIIIGYTNPVQYTDNGPIDYLTKLKAFVAGETERLFGAVRDRNLVNEIDNFITLIDGVMYKLQKLM